MRGNFLYWNTTMPKRKAPPFWERNTSKRNTPKPKAKSTSRKRVAFRIPRDVATKAMFGPSKISHTISLADFWISTVFSGMPPHRPCSDSLWKYARSYIASCSVTDSSISTMVLKGLIGVTKGCGNQSQKSTVIGIMLSVNKIIPKKKYNTRC